MRNLARSAEALARQREEPARATGTGHFAPEAAGKATTELGERNDLETNMLVRSVRSIAFDLLQASGMDSETAQAALSTAPSRGPPEHARQRLAPQTALPARVTMGQLATVLVWLPYSVGSKVRSSGRARRGFRRQREG